MNELIFDYRDHNPSDNPMTDSLDYRDVPSEPPTITVSDADDIS